MKQWFKGREVKQKGENGTRKEVKPNIETKIFNQTMRIYKYVYHINIFFF